jgi:hypothetical protein
MDWKDCALMKRLALVLVALTAMLLAVPAYASNPNHPTGCHGANNVPCRPDPQPTHGDDCTHSDDHSCEVTTSTTTTRPPSTTTSTLPTPTTITTKPAPLPLSTTSTTQASLTTTTAPPVNPSATAAAASPTAAPSTTPTELASTGAGTDVLIGLGLWLIIGGGIAMLVAKIIFKD